MYIHVRIVYSSCKTLKKFEYYSFLHPEYYVVTKGFLIFFLGMALTAGTLAAIVGTVGTGFFVDLMGSFRGFLLLTSLLYFLSALFYVVFSTGDRVNFDEPGEYDILLHLW